MRNETDLQARRQRILRLVTEGLPPLIDVPIPSDVRDADWFRDAGLEDIVRVKAFPAYQIPLYSGKIFPALAMLLADEAAGTFNDRPSVAGSSSGNFIKDMANLARMFNIEKVYAVVNHSLPKGKVHHVECAGAEVVYAPEGIPATDYAYTFAKENGCILEDQYVRDDAVKGHRWSMDHIARQMKSATGDAGFVFAAVTGTCSTLIAAQRYLKPQFKGRVKILGVASMSKEEKVPGSRAPENLIELRSIGGFGWELYGRPKRFLDFPLVDSVTKREAYALNAELHHEADIQAGPTSALLEAGFYRALRDCAGRGDLRSFKNENGLIVAVLFWMDSFLAYIDDAEYRAFFQR